MPTSTDGDPDSLRELARAARLRADTAESAAQGLSALPAVATVGTGASPEALALTRQQLEAHAIEAREVGTAADTAADGVEDLKRRLAELRGRASRHHLRIDGDSDTVTHEATSTGDGQSSQATITALQEKLDAIIADANRIDHELARALGIARTRPKPAENRLPRRRLSLNYP